MSQVTAAATFCATLVDEWARAGVGHAVVSPGSRSTPMALALAANERMHVHIQHDERSSGFMALGLGLAARVPAVVLTTSGTAAAELHPAVIEAHQGAVPMLVCTADRPPELHDVGAPQTIDQTHLYGAAVRWFAEPGVPDGAQDRTWRSFASRAVLEATGRRPGPIHLNLAFRDPLVGDPGPLPPPRGGRTPWHQRWRGLSGLAEDQVERALELMVNRRGVVVAGPGPLSGAVHLLAERLGWPVLAVPRSGAWVDHPTVVTRADALLRVDSFVQDHQPEVVLRFGEVVTSKVVEQWLAASGAPEIAVLPADTFPDPGRRVAVSLETSPSWLCAALLKRLDKPAPVARGRWLEEWQAAQAAAQRALADVLDAHAEPTEPAVARDVLAAMRSHSRLVVSSSMPIRDVEWYADPHPGVIVHANRGANGIDGVVSTAVGVALGWSSPTAVMVGDIAFLHDTNALLGLTARDVNLTIVVIDNDGGGIFSFLPQATDLPSERFEQLLGTPHGVDLTRVAAAHDIPAEVIDQQADLGPAVAESAAAGGVKVLVARTDRAANVAIHDEIHAAVAAAVAASS